MAAGAGRKACVCVCVKFAESRELIKEPPPRTFTERKERIRAKGDTAGLLIRKKSLLSGDTSTWDAERRCLLASGLVSLLVETKQAGETRHPEGSHSMQRNPDFFCLEFKGLFWFLCT